MARRIVTVSRKGSLELALRQAMINRIRKISSQKNIQSAFVSIGEILRSQIIFNIRKKRIIDQGHLLNSIMYEIENARNKTVLKVGSFGIPYAAIHEFGKENISTRQIRAMFAALSRRNRQNPPKGVVDVRNRKFKARPYIRPALKQRKKDIENRFREILNARF